MIFLNLGHNNLKDNFLLRLNSACPNLMCLDLCYNQLSEIDITIENLKTLKNLKMLSLYGNPICLLNNYKKSLLHELV